MIDPKKLKWTAHDDAGERLHATIEFGAMSLHVDAYRARICRKKYIWLANDEDVTMELWNAHGMEGHCETTRIPGWRGQYAVFMSPFCK